MLAKVLGGLLAALLVWGIKAFIGRVREASEELLQESHWECPQCHYENSASSGVCEKCGALKP